MARGIMITAGEVKVEAELNDGPTARMVAGALPIRARGNRWGEEIYFEIPVEADLEADAREVLEAGELGYWPSGNAFCIFFGPTPGGIGGEHHRQCQRRPLATARHCQRSRGLNRGGLASTRGTATKVAQKGKGRSWAKTEK